MEPERIDIATCDLANERMTDVKWMYVELGDNYFLYSAKYYGQETDDDEAQEHLKVFVDHQMDFTLKVKRELVAGIELRWSANKYWYVAIEAIGVLEKIKIYFQTKKEGTVFFNKIDNFIFGTKE